MSVRVMIGDCRERLKELPDESVHCVVTSPPYFGLRDYGVSGQIGLEPTPDAFVSEMVGVFRQVRRVLRSDGTLWLNLGDSYVTSPPGNKPGTMKQSSGLPNSAENLERRRSEFRGAIYDGAYDRVLDRQLGHGENKSAIYAKLKNSGLKQKDLIGAPWRVAFALQADGWWLRQDIIWSKPNPMPESIRDRCTKAHEYLFLLAKSERYYFDQDAIAEPATFIVRPDAPISGFYSEGSGRNDGNTHRSGGFAKSGNKARKDRHEYGGNPNHPAGQAFGVPWEGHTRNKRSVWEVATQPFSEAHFATFPPDLIEPCIKAGCPVGGTVLDPFGGAGTTGLVADRLGRDAILIELNPAYVDLAHRRISDDAGMFAKVAAE